MNKAKEIGIEAILVKPRVFFTGAAGEAWGYTVKDYDLWLARNHYANTGEVSACVVTEILLDIGGTAPAWLCESGVFSFFGPGRAAIREAIETTLTAYLRDF